MTVNNTNMLCFESNNNAIQDISINTLTQTSPVLIHTDKEHQHEHFYGTSEGLNIILDLNF